MTDRTAKGIVQVYTGDGKGKTTAAFGLAVRAVGHEKRVIIIQFMKGDASYGEVKAVRKYLPIRLEQTGTPNFVDKDNPAEDDLAEAKRGLELARQVMASGEYDLVILDEINVAMDFNLLSVESVLELIRQRPARVDLVLTGRYAPQSIREEADLVSEVMEIKHPYMKGIPAREGIEF
ncbi:MAG: cob(I)yrinic acid a,c-diamide adenosyltransferase [Bacillota bacterium]